MNDGSPMLLLGIGTSGCMIARGVSRAFGERLRYAMIDTDAATGADGGPFTLLGGDRLSGRGTGGDIVAARLAAEDSIEVVDEHLEGVRLAVIVTSLGGGTGGGGTLEVAKHLSARGTRRGKRPAPSRTCRGDPRGKQKSPDASAESHRDF